MPVDLFSELGFDADDPEVVAAREDAEELIGLLEHLVERRSTLGLRQIDIAKAMGTTQSAVSDLERLGGDPRISTVQRYARALGARVRMAVADPSSWTAVRYETGNAPAWRPATEADSWPIDSDLAGLAA